MNKLSEVPAGPFAVDLDPRRDGSHQVLEPNRNTICFVSTGRHPEEAEALAELLAASYDHALLLAAITQGFAGVTMPIGIVWVRHKNGADATCPVHHDPFGCPKLTDELRTALRAACGVKP